MTTPPVPAAVLRAREFVVPTLRAAVDTLDPQLRLISAYQFGWVDRSGTPSAGSGGKAIRPTLAVLSAEAAGADPQLALPSAAAVELVHTFSLLHDDVMDGDLERRHRPTAWTVFGTGQTILAGSALLVLAIQLLSDGGPAGQRSLPCLLTAVDELIRGQSADLRLEGSRTADLDACLAMEAGKTASLLSCSASIGALAADAPQETVDALAGYGSELGMAFQLADDVLGITGDPDLTGKSASSDVRAGKTSAPIAAALADGGPASRELAAMLTTWPPQEETEVQRATQLVIEAGGIAWAEKEADRRLDAALAHLTRVPLPERVRGELTDIATFVTRRDS